MNKLDNTSLKGIQKAIFEMLKEVDRICRKNNIKYSLDSGTLIGAIRHNGFVPWDDDGDVVMLRSEYEKFAEACKKDLNTKRFFLQDFDTDPEYRWGYAKLRYNNTLLLKKGQEHCKWHQGIFIDIFIYDGVPDNHFLRIIHSYACYCIRKGLYSVVGRKSADNLLIRSWYALLYLIPRNVWVNLIESIAKFTGEDNHELACHMTYPCDFYGSKFGMPRVSFNDFIDKDFEGHMFKIFKNYDAHLRCMYGDYMVLPPEDKRVGQDIGKLLLPNDIDC